MQDNEHRAHRQRLRKQFLDQGGEGFPAHQLLELLLTFAIPRRNVNPLAHQLIGRYGSLAAVFQADPYELCQAEGVGESTAVLIALVGKLMPMVEYAPAEGRRILTSTDAIPLCRSLVGQSKREELWVVSLNHAHRVLHADRVSSGTPSQTPMYTRLVVECALRHGASGIILCHNHPAGNIRPSPEDVDATQRVVQALAPLGINLYDHIIIGGKNAYSLFNARQLAGGEAEEERLAAAQRKE